MNVLFLTLVDFKSYSEHNIYCDLLREFMKRGHDVYCISPTEKRNGIETHFEEDGHLLKLKIGNTQKTNTIEKGFSTLRIEPQFKSAIKKYFSNIKFDFVIYSTPPITLLNAIVYVKKRDAAKTYLLLKDIFPQNAVDMGMMAKTGLKGIIYKYFRYKEKRLYAVSDRIGCMSQANVDYIIKHNPELDPNVVEVCPNAIEVQNKNFTDEEKREIRKRYGIPLEKKVFIYGGNLGKPQGIPFIINCLRAEKDNGKCFFLIVGDGTEYSKLEAFISAEQPNNVKLMRRMHKDDYDKMVAACDVGLIFLDHRFTIPNFPSRLLGYMQAGIPVLACTDSNTDIGKIIVEGRFGWWVKSNSVNDFREVLDIVNSLDLTKMGMKSRKYLTDNYSVETIYKTIVKD